jgi:hypothetical protein
LLSIDNYPIAFPARVREVFAIDGVERDEFVRLKRVSGEALPRGEIVERDERDPHAGRDAIANLCVPFPQVFETGRTGRRSGKRFARALG